MALPVVRSNSKGENFTTLIKAGAAIGAFVLLLFVFGKRSDDAPRVTNTPPTNEQMTAWSEHIIQQTIKKGCRDPFSVEFKKITGAWHYDDWWAEKYILRTENASGGHSMMLGFAKVKFTGGNYQDDKNWTVVETYVNPID